MDSSLKVSAGCGACLILFGILMCAVLFSNILAQTSRLDMALILSVMGLVMFFSFFVGPGLLMTIQRRIDPGTAFLFGLVGGTMMWTLIAFLAIGTAAGIPFLEEEFYEAFLPMLGLGFFAGLFTAGATMWVFEQGTAGRKSKGPEEKTSETGDWTR